MKLDPEEADLLASFERGEWQSVGNAARHRKDMAAMARATLRKDRRINIRVSARDLELIQGRAVAEGMPYQTLIASILHKYAAGRLRGA